MRLKAPRVPTAASAAFGANVGPRVLPGTYTVKMTKDKQVYTTKLQLVADPRSTHTPEDRKAQFDLAMKVYAELGNMTFAVDRINGLRLALDERAGKLTADDALAARLHTASTAVDTLRQKIVATKEGGMITGEERLREYLTSLYGHLVFYEGRPSATEVERAAALSHELSDVVAEFDAWAAKELPGLNDALAAKSLPKIELLSRADWEKQGAEGGGSGNGGAVFERDRPFERD